MHLIQTSEPPKPRKVDPGIPRDLEIICLKAIDKDPERRYATALEFAEDLERYLRDEPILARAPSTFTRVMRFVRRRKMPIAASVLLVVAAVMIVSLVRRDRTKQREWNEGEAHRKVEAALMRTLAGKQSEVLAMLDEAERLDPKLSDVNLQRGLLYFNLDQGDKALAELDKGLVKSPGDPALEVGRGTVLRFMGREKEAQQALSSARLESVNDPMRLTALGIFQVTNGWARSATETFELAKRTAPAWPQSRFGLALAHYRLRRFDSAADVLKTFLDLDPGHAVGEILLLLIESKQAGFAAGETRADLVAKVQQKLDRYVAAAPDEPLTAGLAAIVASFDGSEAGRKVLAERLARVDELLKTTPSEKLRVSGGILYEIMAQLALPIDRDRAKEYAESALKIRHGTDSARVVLADLKALAGTPDGRTEALADYIGVSKDFPQATMAPGRILDMRRAYPTLVPDDVADSMVELVILTQPEDPELLISAAEVAASLPARKAEAPKLFASARRLWEKWHNEAKLEQIKARLAKGI
jgi:tetratricopeptide (TPR) repeat protein